MNGYYWCDCMICYNEIFALNSNEIHFLFDDSKWRGKPICNNCFEMLNKIIPEKLDVIDKYLLKKGNKPEIKKNLERWL